MANKRIHYDRLQEALKKKKLIVFQYSCSDIHKPPIRITSAFGIDYFSDNEWWILGNDKNFRQEVIKYLNKHNDYYFLIWNFNAYYSFQNFDLGFSENKLKQLIERCIDFDDVLEVYAEDNNIEYIKKVEGGFDSRYYLALLNDIRLTSEWVWGGIEKDLDNYPKLKESSRLKTKVMVSLLDRLIKKSIRVEHNDKLIEKSKEIIKYPKKESEKETKYHQSPHIEKSNIENVNINYGDQTNKQSVTYEGDKQNVMLYEVFSPILIKKFGERKLGIAGGISLIVGIIQLFIWMNSITSTKIFSYLPKFSENINKWFLWIGIIFFIVGAFLIGVIVYFRNSKCKKCGKLFAYSEDELPDVEEVKVHNGTRIQTIRKYKCKYCGDTQKMTETELKEYGDKNESF